MVEVAILGMMILIRINKHINLLKKLSKMSDGWATVQIKLPTLLTTLKIFCIIPTSSSKMVMRMYATALKKRYSLKEEIS